MSIIWSHDLMDHSQITLSVTQGVTFEYALNILRKQKLHFSNTVQQLSFPDIIIISHPKNFNIQIIRKKRNRNI